MALDLGSGLGRDGPARNDIVRKPADSLVHLDQAASPPQRIHCPVVAKRRIPLRLWLPHGRTSSQEMHLKPWRRSKAFNNARSAWTGCSTSRVGVNLAMKTIGRSSASEILTVASPERVR
jgi:hypothetical protein